MLIVVDSFKRPRYSSVSHLIGPRHVYYVHTLLRTDEVCGWITHSSARHLTQLLDKQVIAHFRMCECMELEQQLMNYQSITYHTMF
jgi:hypothetical protein